MVEVLLAFIAGAYLGIASTWSILIYLISLNQDSTTPKRVILAIVFGLLWIFVLPWVVWGKT